jgi:hypothetical protein
VALPEQWVSLWFFLFYFFLRAGWCVLNIGFISLCTFSFYVLSFRNILKGNNLILPIYLFLHSFVIQCLLPM